MIGVFQMFKLTSSKLGLIFGLLLLASLNMVACSSDEDNNSPMGPQTNPIAAANAGTYDTHYRWGGASGAWRAPSTVTVNNDGTVFYGTTQIINPTFGPDALSWSLADGNRQNAAVTFQATDNRDYYWRDKGSVSKRNFTGWLQNPGEGKLDFRGLIQ